MAPRVRYRVTSSSMPSRSELEPNAEPGVLRNKLGIKNRSEIELTEARLLLAMEERSLGWIDEETSLTCKNIQRLHKEWLGSLYSWAGTYRTIVLSKPGWIWPAAYIDSNMEAFETKPSKNARLAGEKQRRLLRKSRGFTAIALHPSVPRRKRAALTLDRRPDGDASRLHASRLVVRSRRSGEKPSYLLRGDACSLPGRLRAFDNACGTGTSSRPAKSPGVSHSTFSQMELSMIRSMSKFRVRPGFSFRSISWLCLSMVSENQLVQMVDVTRMRLADNLSEQSPFGFVRDKAVLDNVEKNGFPFALALRSPPLSISFVCLFE